MESVLFRFLRWAKQLEVDTIAPMALVLSLFFFFLNVCPWHQKQKLVVPKQKVNLPTNTLLHAVDVWQIGAEGHFDKMASDMEVQMKQRKDEGIE